MHWTWERSRPTLCPETLYLSTSLLMESQTAQYFHSPRKGMKRDTTSIPSTALQLDYFYCIWRSSLFSIRYLNAWSSQKSNRNQWDHPSSACLKLLLFPTEWEAFKQILKVFFLLLHLHHLPGQWAAILLDLIKIKRILTNAQCYF